MWFQKTLTLSTSGRGTYEITSDVAKLVKESRICIGLCHIFVQHTSASFILCENADPDVRHDLETFMSGAVIDGDKRFRHTDEGPDDMSAHIRSVLTLTEVCVPIKQAHLLLGTWQGLFVWEHRTAPHTRHIVVTLQGEVESPA
jgi:secondary thiamine-phosphate synthase enzyme